MVALMVERREYNRRFGQMADSARDWIASHYAAPAAVRVFAKMQKSAELERELDQFSRRQRPPYLDEAPMADDEWSALMFVLGVPSKTSALSLAEGGEKGHVARAAFQQDAQDVLQTAPPYIDWIQSKLQLS